MAKLQCTDTIRIPHKGSTQCFCPPGWGIHNNAEYQVQPHFSRSGTWGWLLSLRNNLVCPAVCSGGGRGVCHDFHRAWVLKGRCCHWSFWLMRPTTSHASLWFLLQSVLEAFRITEVTCTTSVLVSTPPLQQQTLTTLFSIYTKNVKKVQFIWQEKCLTRRETALMPLGDTTLIFSGSSTNMFWINCVTSNSHDNLTA